MFYKILFVGLGGFIGAIFRYVFSTFFQTTSRATNFPVGTLIVNMVGCFGLSFFVYYLRDKGWVTDHHTAFLLTGFFGAFTTFSTFELEVFSTFSSSGIIKALLYLMFSIAGGFGLIIAGKNLADFLVK